MRRVVELSLVCLVALPARRTLRPVRRVAARAHPVIALHVLRIVARASVARLDMLELALVTELARLVLLEEVAHRLITSATSSALAFAATFALAADERRHEGHQLAQLASHLRVGIGVIVLLLLRLLRLHLLVPSVLRDQGALRHLRYALDPSDLLDFAEILEPREDVRVLLL